MKMQTENSPLQTKERSHNKETTPPDTYVLDFWPQNCETMSFCWPHHQVCSTWLQQPERTNMAHGRCPRNANFLHIGRLEPGCPDDELSPSRDAGTFLTALWTSPLLQRSCFGSCSPVPSQAQSSAVCWQQKFLLKIKRRRSKPSPSPSACDPPLEEMALSLSPPGPVPVGELKSSFPTEGKCSGVREWVRTPELSYLVLTE